MQALEDLFLEYMSLLKVLQKQGFISAVLRLRQSKKSYFS